MNEVTQQNTWQLYAAKNQLSELIEKASIAPQTIAVLGIIGDLLNTNDAASVLQDGRVRREFVNVLFDWYAPIKWSPILDVSKEVGWLFLQNRLNE
jgi:hypothetical protein